MRLSRAERSVLADWWFTVDRLLLATILVIAGAGLLLSLAASPTVAVKRGLPTYYFVERHLVFALAGIVLMLSVSALSPRAVRRLALIVMAAGLGMMLLVILDGTEINGARRWLHVGGFSLQPSEFAKAAFVVLSAWLFAEAERQPEIPAMPLACLLYFMFAGLLVLQPDVGQTLLVSLLWCALFLLAGRPLKWLLVFAIALSAGLIAAYFSLGYVRWRVERFLNPLLGDSFQTDRALQSFLEGGFFGKGPGEGTIKSVLPDAHADFIFAVVAEEYGALACLVLLGLFALVAIRVFSRLGTQSNAFGRLSAAGLCLLFVLQAAVNMAVNVGLIPAKGITLPFISSGGSSTLGMSLAMGMLLALTRRGSEHAVRVKKPGFAPKRATLGTTGSWPL